MYKNQSVFLLICWTIRLISGAVGIHQFVGTYKDDAFPAGVYPS